MEKENNKIVVGFDHIGYDGDRSMLRLAEKIAADIKQHFVKQEVEFTLDAFFDVLLGGRKLEELFYDRMNKDLKLILSPVFRKSQKELIEDDLQRTLQDIRAIVNSPYRETNWAHLVRNYKDYFTISRGQIKLIASKVDALKEAYTQYASDKDIELFKLANNLIPELNKIRSLWSDQELLSLDALFESGEDGFKVNYLSREKVDLILKPRETA